MKFGRKTHVFIDNSAAALFKLLDKVCITWRKTRVFIGDSAAALLKLLDRGLYNLEKDSRLYKYIAILPSTAVLIFRSRQRL